MCQLVINKSCEHHYITMSLDFEDGVSVSITEVRFNMLISAVIREMFGDVGAATDVKLLSFKEDKLLGLLQVPTGALRKVWFALTLFSNYGRERCAFRIHQISPDLIAL